MFSLTLSIVFALAAVFAPFLVKDLYQKIGIVALGAVLSIGSGLMTSTLNVDKDHIALLNRVYLASNLPSGKVMMVDEEGTTYKGMQPHYITEGYHFIPFVAALNDIEEVSVIEVPQGKYLQLTAREGKELPRNAFMAPEWKAPSEDMLKPDFFLSNGGYKGPQMTVLPPGKYPIHTGFWSVKLGDATTIQTGQVGVVRSNADSGIRDCTKAPVTRVEGIQTDLVARGCQGIWKETLQPGRYYLNEVAYTVTVIGTRAQSWKYKGGYVRRIINLTVADNGSISQEEQKVNVPNDKDYADSAIIVRTLDGQEVPVEVRLQVQVQPEDAPRVVAGVGNIEAVEDRVVGPIIGDILRQIAGETKATELVSKRGVIVDKIEAAVIPEAAKAGVTITEARVGDIILPPELLLPDRRKQLASSLTQTYIQEAEAAKERALSENAIAVANQQSTIVAAEMGKQAAKLIGEGERDRLVAIAEGQAKQMAVIGRDKTVELQMFDRLMVAAEKNPDIIKVPVVSVSGTGGAEGAAAILGATSNIGTFLNKAK